MTTIDFHAHILHPELLSISQDKVVLTGFGATPPRPRPPGSRAHESIQLMLRPDLHVAEMDRRNIDVHVLSSSTVVQGTFWAAPDEEPRLCAVMNDAMNDWVKAHPDRFIGSMVLPFQNLPATLAEIERCRARYGFCVVNAPANVNGRYLGDPSFNDYWRVAAEAGLITFIHPDGVRDPWFQRYSLWNSVGQPIEETKVIASLIYEGVLERHPEIAIVISHGGGYAPLFMGRLDRNVTNMPDSTVNIQGFPSEYIRRMSYDICVYDPAALSRLIEHVGADRLLLGSDFPFGDPTAFHLLDQVKGLSPEDRQRITGGNASALLQTVTSSH
jgi:aminocarboxymuconate-semialdehyde decarboxylase